MLQPFFTLEKDVNATFVRCRLKLDVLKVQFSFILGWHKVAEESLSQRKVYLDIIRTWEQRVIDNLLNASLESDESL